MRPKSIFAACTDASGIVIATPLIERQSQDAGYLAAVFTGQEEQIFFRLADKNNPQSFRSLNGGQPSLIATLGTQGARDPSIVQSVDGAKFWILATDLQIGRTDWNEAQTHGSRALHIWESMDGVNWTADRLATVMDATAGYVWAPSAVWDVTTKQYAVFWSSRVYAASDPSHDGTSQGPFIYYSHTNDFKTFTTAQRWDPSDSRTVIDQEIQYLNGSTYIRYLSDTADVQRVVLDRSDDGLFGTWNRIGVPVDQLREGPASFRDILNSNRYYLWEDNYNGEGYECYYTEDFKVPFNACPQAVTPSGMRHGGVVQVDQTRYNNLARNITS